MLQRLVVLSILLNFSSCRDYYVGMFKKDDFLVAQDTLYKEKANYGYTTAKYGRLFNCPITYFRVVDRLGVGRPPRVQVTRGGLRKKYITLLLTASYNTPIAVNIYVGCENKLTVEKPTTTPKPEETTKAEGETTAAKETGETPAAGADTEAPKDKKAAGDAAAGDAAAGGAAAGGAAAGGAAAGGAAAGGAAAGGAAAGGAAAGGAAAGGAAAGDAKAGDAPAGETPAGQTPAGENAAENAKEKPAENAK